MLSLFRYAVIFSFFYSLIALSILVFGTFSFGKRVLHAQQRGNTGKGVIYAFLMGMMPWEKESAGKHLPTYGAGMVFHAGVFSALFYLFSLIVSFTLPPYILVAVQILVGLGFLCGFGLFLKRIVLASMRSISCPDDFISNFLVDAFLALALAASFFPDITLYLYILSTVMFFYIPLGKIRHCFFFFYTRILFGRFYGRRGVLPSHNIKYQT